MTTRAPILSSRREAIRSDTGAREDRGLYVPLALIVPLIFVARFTSVGADAHWLVALGNDVVANRRVPDGLPFAAAATEDWPNVVVLAEVVFSVLHSFGDTGLALAQLAVVAATLALLVVGARREGATARGASIALLLTFMGGVSAFVLIRLQLFSLVPFAALLLLLRSEHHRPSARIWWVVPLLVLWSNLHGAVLMGFAVTGCHLLFSRLPKAPVIALSVGMASLAALWVTPAGLRTGHYYYGVLTNEAAIRGTDLWAKPAMDNRFDVLMIVAGLVLLGFSLPRRHPLWEYVAAAGLLIATVLAARHGLWLLMLLSAPAAAVMSSRQKRTEAHVSGRSVFTVALPSLVLLCTMVVSRGDGVSSVPPWVVQELSEFSGDRTVLAPEPLVESLAVAGARVWAADPIDAYARVDQAAYLDFLMGGPGASRALDAAEIVIVEPGSRPESVVKADAEFVLLRSIHGWDVYARSRNL